MKKKIPFLDEIYDERRREYMDALEEEATWIERMDKEKEMSKLRIKIPVKGNPEIKVEGISGSGCKSLTAGLEKALGKTVKSEPTNEFYQEPHLERNQEIETG